MFLKPVSVFAMLHVNDVCAERHFTTSKVPAVSQVFHVKKSLATLVSTPILFNLCCVFVLRFQ